MSEYISQASSSATVSGFLAGVNQFNNNFKIKCPNCWFRYYF